MPLDWIRARVSRRCGPAGLSAFSLVCMLGAATPVREEPPARPAAAQAPAPQDAPAAAEKPGAAAEQAMVADGSGPLEITVLRVGREPHAWGEADARTGRRPLLSFITDDLHTCRVAAWARVNGQPAAAAGIRWEIEPPAGFVVEGEPAPGPKLRAVLKREEAPAPTVGPLSLTVRARLALDGRLYEVALSVMQDLRDQMRQEYVDLEREIIPGRHRFLDAAEFQRRFGKRFPTILFEEINFSLNPATGERYPYVIVTEALMLGLKRAERLLGTAFVHTSGYRNPRRQEQVHAPVDESQHQYGYAADLAVLPGEGREAPNEADWLRMAEAACAVGARFVEPMTLCHVNTLSCHLHMDFRESGTVTAPIRIKGVVRDAASGQPVPDALVTYGGMPARTGPNGYFALRNVLAVRERPLEVQAAGYTTLTQPLAAAAGTTEVQLALQPGPRPVLAVTAGPAAWKNEAAGVGTLELQLRNTGAAEARDVRLRVPGFQVAPERLTALPAGKTHKITLFFRRDRGSPPEPLTVALEMTYAGPEGRALAQTLTAAAAAPAWTAPPPAPAAAPAPAPTPSAAKPNALNTAAAAGSTAAVLGAAVTLQRRKQRKAQAETEEATEPKESTPSPAPAPPPENAAPDDAAPMPEAGAEPARMLSQEREPSSLR